MVPCHACRLNGEQRQEPDISCVWSLTWSAPGKLCESPVEFILKVDSPVLPSRASKSCHGSRTEELGLERKLGHTQPGLAKAGQGGNSGDAANPDSTGSPDESRF